MFGYVYITRNNINNKIYIGKREKSYFDVGYIGSGKYLKHAIDKYVKDNFSCEILAETFLNRYQSGRLKISKPKRSISTWE